MPRTHPEQRQNSSLIRRAVRTSRSWLDSRLRKNEQYEYVIYQLAIFFCILTTSREQQQSTVELISISLLSFLVYKISSVKLAIAILPVPFLFSMSKQRDRFYDAVLQSIVSVLILSSCSQKKQIWRSKVRNFFPGWALATAIILGTWMQLLGRTSYRHDLSISLANKAVFLIQYTLCLLFLSKEADSSFSVGELVISVELLSAAYVWCISVLKQWIRAQVYEQFTSLFLLSTWIFIWSLHVSMETRSRWVKYGIILLCQGITMLSPISVEPQSVFNGLESLTLVKLLSTGYATVTDDKFFDWWLMKYWILVGVTFSALLVIAVRLKLHKSISQLSSQRKIFHALALLLFVPGMHRSPHFLRFGFMLAIALFIIEEQLRWRKLMNEKFQQRIETFLMHVVNFQTEPGPILMSHTYLLVGCGFSLLLNTRCQDLSYEAMLGPLLLLGLGDSFSSIVGRLLGRHRWSRTRKTVEGTVAAIASTHLGLYTLAWYKSLILQHTQRFFVATVFSFLIEAFTDDIDNLILPIMFECVYRSAQFG